MERRTLPASSTSLNIAGCLLLIMPAIMICADRWIWDVPHGLGFKLFEAAWWTAEATALASIPFTTGGRGFLRVVLLLLGVFEMWLVYRWFSLA